MKYDPFYSIDMCALVLIYGVETPNFEFQGLNNEYWLYNAEQIKAMFKRYNATDYNIPKVILHSEKVYEIYSIFKENNI